MQKKNEKVERVPRMGDIYMMLFSGSGNEQSGWRPGVVFQNNIGNAKSPNIIALPLTTNLKKKNMPTHVLVRADESGLKKDSMVLCENPERMSKSKLGRYVTTLNEEQMSEIAKANMVATAAISFLDEATLLNTWRLSRRVNSCVV